MLWRGREGEAEELFRDFQIPKLTDKTVLGRAVQHCSGPNP